MYKKIEKILKKLPGIKARVIASKIGEDKSAVSAYMHDHPELFVQDAAYGWSLAKAGELRIELPAGKWLTADLFEDALTSSESALVSKCEHVVFVLAKDSKLLLEATARLLALCNQLVHAEKKVSVDFSDCHSTLDYFNRIGFFDFLDPSISIIPSRPEMSKAGLYKGGNNGVVEVAMIDPVSPDEDIPGRLQKSFVSCAGAQYSVGAFTVLSELFGNVRDHSDSPIPGFAALQFYPRSRQPHIQAVISDSGRGILGTLAPVLETRYPKVATAIRASGLHAGVALIQEIFRNGGISSNEDEARGLGLKRSGDVAYKFNARISVRQETFEVKVHYNKHGNLEFSHQLDLRELRGTHVCFDFLLDGTR
ncbi:hypothetical protein K6W26_19660 [Burkholderia sp. AU42008]|uniref:hypothetical protein n=1 Tax=Burkholderia sp. AU42008 TaxID=2871156 RepID=UPI001C934CC6|nr:hypothetical protein [Burkholderia sp. AU42008]MBY4875275.1 hypothetical protein [Burkholderia sp. AU42008]